MSIRLEFKSSAVSAGVCIYYTMAMNRLWSLFVEYHCCSIPEWEFFITRCCAGLCLLKCFSMKCLCAINVLDSLKFLMEMHQCKDASDISRNFNLEMMCKALYKCKIISKFNQCQQQTYLNYVQLGIEVGLCQSFCKRQYIGLHKYRHMSWIILNIPVQQNLLISASLPGKLQ